MRHALFVAVPVLLAALAVAAAASGSPRMVARGVAAPVGFHEARSLEPAASYVARKPVKVWCANTGATWARYVGSADPADTLGETVPGSDALRLHPNVCAVFARFEGGSLTPQTLPGYATAIETLTHEAIHARGETDEGVTDCDAIHEMPGVAVRFFHVKAGKHLRALMAAAWREHRTKPAAYASVC